MSIQHWILEGGGAKQWGWRNSVCENTHCDWLDSIYILVLQFVISPYQLTLSAEAERRTGKCNRGREREREREKGGRDCCCVQHCCHSAAARLSGKTAWWREERKRGSERKRREKRRTSCCSLTGRNGENKGRMELAFSSLQERKSCTFVLSSMLSLFSHPVLNALR